MISRKAIREFTRENPDATAPLSIWHKEVTNDGWKSTSDLRATFRDADIVGDKVVFNIARNRYRLIAFVAYRARKVFIKAILTHKQYDKETWK